MFFAAVVEISDVGDEDDVLILAFDDIFQEGQDFVPFRIGEAVTRRVVGRRIHDDNRVVLFGNHIADVGFEAFHIEMAIGREQFKFTEFAAIIVAHGAVSPPMPVTGQDFIAPFGIVVNDVMEDTGTAGRSTGADVAFRTGFTEALVDSSFQIIGIALDRRIGDDFFRRQGFVGFLDDVEHDEIPIFIEHGTVPLITLSAPNFSVKATARLLAPKILSSALFPFACGAATLFTI